MRITFDDSEIGVGGRVVTVGITHEDRYKMALRKKSREDSASYGPGGSNEQDVDHSAEED